MSARININLSTISKIIDNQWNDVPNQYENVELDYYVIMSNHLHGIMIINNPVGNGHVRSANKNTMNNNLSVIIGSLNIGSGMPEPYRTIVIFTSVIDWYKIKIKKITNRCTGFLLQYGA